MLSKKMSKAFNAQITKEFASSYLYLQMAAWFEHQGLPGFASWMKVQAQEEAAHTLILFNFVCSRGGMVELGNIEPPQHTFKSTLDVFEKTLAHERKVTAWIHELMDLALEEKDHASKARLDWFVSEQVGEEAQVTELVNRLRLTAKDSGALFWLDKELSARAFVVPGPLAGA